MQNYRVRLKKVFSQDADKGKVESKDGVIKVRGPTQAYGKWFDALKVAKAESLMPALEHSDLLLDNDVYQDASAPLGSFMVEVPDFNSLIAISQSLSKPVFMLDVNDIKTSGSVADNQLVSVKQFQEIYSGAADKIIALLK